MAENDRVATSATNPPGQRLTETPAGFSGRFRRAGRRAWVTSVLLGVVGFVALLSLIQEGSALRLIDDARQGILYGYEASEQTAGRAYSPDLPLDETAGAA